MLSPESGVDSTLICEGEGVGMSVDGVRGFWEDGTGWDEGSAGTTVLPSGGLVESRASVEGASTLKGVPQVEVWAETEADFRPSRERRVVRWRDCLRIVGRWYGEDRI